MGQILVAGRYRLLDRHAIGGMAAIWRARDEWTGEEVALKRVHPYLVEDPAARARLDREAAALRAIDHPAIVRPRDLIDDPDDPALVMDFAAGEPLSERIARGPLPVDESVAIAATMADALATAHRHGIVHRDIKPSNILVEADGALHLVDFGIASQAALDEEGLTAARSMVGTLRYAAPERLEGRPATPTSDVWALGAVLYEMATGQPAVRAVDSSEALAASRAAPADLGLAPRLIGPIIERAMAQDPAARYPDAGAFRDALVALDEPADPDAVTEIVPAATPARASVPLAAGGWPATTIGRWRTIAIGSILAGASLVVAASLTLSGPTDRAEQRGVATLAPPSPATSQIAIDPVADPSGTDHGKGRGNGKGKSH